MAFRTLDTGGFRPLTTTTPVQPIATPEKSTETYGAFFPGSKNDNPIVAGIKAAGNLPSSALNFGKDIYSAVRNPIKTLGGVSNLLMGGTAKAVDVISGVKNDDKYTQTFDALTASLKDRYGSLENLQQTATNDPFAFGSDVLGLVTGGATLAGKGATATRAISKTAQIATKPATLVGNTVKNAVPKILSYTSDVPEQAFKNLLANREVITPKIGVVDQAQALKTARGATRQLRKTLSADWEEAIPKIADEFQGQRMGISGKTEKMLDDVADEFGIDLPQNIQSVSAIEGIDLLKKINELPKAVLTFSPKGAQVRELKALLREQVIKTFGGETGSVANLYKNYSSKKSVFDAANDIVNAFNEGRPIKDTTAMNRLQNIFDENKPAYLDAIMQLEKETGIDIISDITASKFKSIAPNTLNKLASAGGLATKKGLVDKLINTLAFPLTSPRSAAFIQRNLKLPKFVDDINNFRVPGSVAEYISDPKVGLSLDDITKRIPKEDLYEMRDFTDFVNGAYKPKNVEQLRLDAQRIAERYGFNAFSSDKSLATQFGKVLDKQLSMTDKTLRDELGRFAGSGSKILKGTGAIPKELGINADEYLYHGTNEVVLDSITKEGLRPMMRGQLSLSTAEDYAKKFASEGMTPKGKTSAILFRVKKDVLNGKTVKSNKARPASDELYEVLTNEAIPPKFIEIKVNGKWQPLIDFYKKVMGKR